MKHISKLAIGDRITVNDCLLVMVTTYRSDREGDNSLLFRHAIQMPDNTKLVYTGAKQLGREGVRYDITATIKRFENRFGIIRLSRPIFHLSETRQIRMSV